MESNFHFAKFVTKSKFNLYFCVSYVKIVDGWSNLGGTFDFILTNYNSKATTSTISMVTSSSIQVSTQRVDVNTNTKWNNRTSVESSPLLTPPQSSYFWSANAWTPCNSSCGGGYQDAHFKCYIGNYIEADTSYCLQTTLPKISQECNVIECRQYNLYIGEWNECDKVCGQGYQKRLVLCLDNLGNIAHRGLCGPKYDLVLKTQMCISQTCNATYWDVTAWEFCNVPCGIGVRSRDAICRSTLCVEPDAACSQLARLTTQEACNTHPCQTYSWLVGPWDECFGTCEGIQRRQVQCVDGSGVTSRVELCDARNKPNSTMSCLQSNVICDGQMYCSEYGQLEEGKCICQEGWERHQCENYKKCQGRPIGFLDHKLDCCPYFTIDTNLQCCISSTSTLTFDGLCCEEGNIDACGQCNGVAKYVDSQATCCSTIRDEKGICCSSGFLDECHVCDGDGITCATNITLLVNFNSDLTITSEAHERWKLLIFVLTSNIASKLGLGDDAVIVSSLQLKNSYEGDCSTNIDRDEACLRNGHYDEFGIINMTLLPKPKDRLTQMIFASNDMYQILRDISISNEFSVNIGNASQNLLVSLYVDSILDLEKVGVCGNGICEKGERCDYQSKSAIQHGDNSCCFEDCPYISLTCPIPMSGPYAQKACSNKGLCLDASGQCQCFLGYSGTACDQCIKGWKKVENESLCIITSIPENYDEMDLFKNSTNNSMEINSPNSHVVTIIIFATFFSLVAYYMFRRQNNTTQRHRYSNTMIENS